MAGQEKPTEVVHRRLPDRSYRSIPAGKGSSRLLFVDSQPFTHSELAAALARPGAGSRSGP